MSDLRPKPATIKLGEKEYGLLFNLNAIDEIQDKFDVNISNLPELMANERKVFKVLKELLAILINEAAEDTGAETVTPQFVGRKITVAEIPALKDAIFAAFSDGAPEHEAEDPTTGE